MKVQASGLYTNAQGNFRCWGNLGKNNGLREEILVVGLISEKNKRLHFY
jgi:hypothetical protein